MLPAHIHFSMPNVLIDVSLNVSVVDWNGEKLRYILFNKVYSSPNGSAPHEGFIVTLAFFGRGKGSFIRTLATLRYTHIHNV